MVFFSKKNTLKPNERLLRFAHKSFILTLLLGAFFCFIIPARAQNQEIKLSVPLSDQPVKNYGDYIYYSFQFFTFAASVIAVFMLLVGGVRWIVSAGKTDEISEAKSMISGAVVGLIILLLAYLILNTVNANLVKLRAPITGGISEAEQKAAESLTSQEAALKLIKEEQNPIEPPRALDAGEAVAPATKGIKVAVPFPFLPENLQNFGQYISAFYRFGFFVAAIIAVLMAIFGGVQWTLSAGNSEKISEAKSFLANGLLGLALLLSSFLILNTLNPSLVNEFSPLNILNSRSPLPPTPVLTPPKGNQIPLSVPLPNALYVSDTFDYIVKIFEFSLYALAIFAVLMIIIAGYISLTSMGSSEGIQKSKEFIGGAVIGLVILLCATLLLNTIDTELTRLGLSKGLAVPVVAKRFLCCKDKLGTVKRDQFHYSCADLGLLDADPKECFSETTTTGCCPVPKLGGLYDCKDGYTRDICQKRTLDASGAEIVTQYDFYPKQQCKDLGRICTGGQNGDVCEKNSDCASSFCVDVCVFHNRAWLPNYFRYSGKYCAPSEGFRCINYNRDTETLSKNPNCSYALPVIGEDVLSKERCLEYSKENDPTIPARIKAWNQL
ncbi:MAG: hypothetical protein HY453_00460 [Parcubacteria group bacterium]|nr:hypothetical protein [Parcubacteria group bacterium]